MQGQPYEEVDACKRNNHTVTETDAQQIAWCTGGSPMWKSMPESETITQSLRHTADYMVNSGPNKALLKGQPYVDVDA